MGKTEKRIVKKEKAISYYGAIGSESVQFFQPHLQACKSGDVVEVVLTTEGGSLLATAHLFQLIQEAQQRGATMLMVGKTMVASAGVLLLSAVPPENRILYQGCRFGIHHIQCSTVVHLEGATGHRLNYLKELLSECESEMKQLKLWMDRLARGSSLSGAELLEKATHYWELSPQEALEYGLIGSIR
jgi:ATP-dependent protease ClpP protease subunit